MFVILLTLLLVLGYGVSLKILRLPVYLVGIVLFALGLAWVISALNVFLRDIGQVLGVVVNLWFYFTPIIYPLNLIPEGFRAWFALNPMLHPVEGYRVALLGRGEPSLTGLIIIFGWGIGTFAIGGFTFKRLKPAFADVL